MSTEPQIPDGMVEVSQVEFFALLKADPRDIMPSTEAREHTAWRVVATRATWGWSMPGWANPRAPKHFAVLRSVKEGS